MRTLVVLALLVPALVSAATLYKSTTPDGRVVYSDTPPETGKLEKTFNYSNLPATPLPEAVVNYRADLEKSAQRRIAASDAKQPVLFWAKWCGYCRQAEAYLNEKRIGFQKQDVDTPEGKRALAQAGGGRGVPVILVGSQKVQGYSRPAYDALFAR